MKHLVRQIFIYSLLSLLISSPSMAAEYQWEDLKRDWMAPLNQKSAYPVAISGTVLTGVLVMFRDELVEPLQEDVSQTRPLGEWAKYGDLMGQLVPNALYMGAMYAYGQAKDDTRGTIANKRAIYMLKTTAYAGITTTILKRIVNQRRPDKGDRLSFPSGHTTTAFAFASAVGMEHKWYWGVGAYAIAGLVGYSRINDNVHYLHDVVFGATIGISYGVALHELQGKNSSAFIYPIMNRKSSGVGITMLF